MAGGLSDADADDFLGGFEEDADDWEVTDAGEWGGVGGDGGFDDLGGERGAGAFGGLRAGEDDEFGDLFGGNFGGLGDGDDPFDAFGSHGGGDELGPGGMGGGGALEQERDSGGTFDAFSLAPPAATPHVAFGSGLTKLPPPSASSGFASAGPSQTLDFDVAPASFGRGGGTRAVDLPLQVAGRSLFDEPLSPAVAGAPPTRELIARVLPALGGAYVDVLVELPEPTQEAYTATLTVPSTCELQQAWPRAEWDSKVRGVTWVGEAGRTPSGRTACAARFVAAAGVPPASAAAQLRERASVTLSCGRDSYVYTRS